MTNEGRDPKGLSRREALVLGGAVAGAVLAESALGPARVLAAEGLPAPSPHQVPRRVLGKTGKSIPILLLGGADGFDKRFDPKLVESVRFGVNYVDAADCYAGGTCESAVGTFHTRFGAREQLWITSKSDAHDPEGFEKTLAQSLERLRTSYVDMYYLHNLSDPELLSPKLAETVKRLVGEGTIRHFGFSCHESNVPKLLELAARTPWVESVMFRYNFRQYGQKELDAAMNAAHGAGVGLIAMKTQGSEGKRDAWKEFQQNGRWNKFQSVLKLVWADPRITAAVSHMETLEKLRENVAAAVDVTELSAVERSEVERYAAATRALACDGCDHLCGAAVAGDVRIADTMRFLMYHDVYDRPGRARELFAQLPEAARRLDAYDFAPASRACPNGVDVAAHMRRAAAVLA